MDEFLPERWSEDNPQIENLKDMFMPFALGKRNCIGQNMAMMQLKILAANFMRYYDFELAGDENIEFQLSLTLKPEQLLMRVYPRHV